MQDIERNHSRHTHVQQSSGTLKRMEFVGVINGARGTFSERGDATSVILDIEKWWLEHLRNDFRVTRVWH